MEKGKNVLVQLSSTYVMSSDDKLDLVLIAMDLAIYFNEREKTSLELISVNLL